MALFKKSNKIETTEMPKTSEQLKKELEEVMKKEKEIEQKRKEKEQFNESEDIGEFINDENAESTDLITEIERFAQNNGVLQTINYLNEAIVQLNVQLVIDTLNNGSTKNEEESGIKFEE